jgi:GAF domain-containing protein
MTGLQDLLFSTAAYQRLTEKERARTVYTISVGLLILVIILAFAVVNDAGLNLFQRAMTERNIAIPMLVFFTLDLASYVLTRLGFLKLGALSLVLTWTLGFGGASAVGGGYTAVIGMVVIITVLLSALLLRISGLVLGVALAFAIIGGSILARSSAPLPTFDGSIATEVIPEAFIIVIAAGIALVYLRVSNLNREETMLEAATGRLRLAQITSQITQRISSRMSLDEALNEAVDYIVNHYPEIYHAQIFLVDETGGKAFLEASTGEAGRHLLARNHHLSVGGQSVIGEVTGKGEPVVARANRIGSVHRPNEYLLQTRVEAAFPLKIGDTVIGALDLQSTHENAFPESDLPIFQTLADHIAIAVDNARLFQETQAQLEANTALANQAQQSLHQVEELNRRLTMQSWSEYLGRNRSLLGLDIDLLTGKMNPNERWTPTMQAAITQADMVEQVVDGQRVLVVPVRVRGEVIGALEFDLDAEGQLLPEDRKLVQDITERFGLAAENVRLFDASQRSAQREALINEASTRLQSAASVESTMTEAARSLQKMLKAGRVSIRLGEPPVLNGSGKDGAA